MAARSRKHRESRIVRTLVMHVIAVDRHGQIERLDLVSTQGIQKLAIQSSPSYDFVVSQWFGGWSRQGSAQPRGVPGWLVGGRVADSGVTDSDRVTYSGRVTSRVSGRVVESADYL